MKEIKLFDYQEDMKERIEKALRLHRSVMAQMPTGTGKTYLLTAVIDSFVSNNPMEKVWIVAHRRELVSQIDETVRKFHSYSTSNRSVKPLPFNRQGVAVSPRNLAFGNLSHIFL